jgi:YHS domain-containing protein
MTVDDKSPHKSTHAGKNYVFCSASCRAKFDRDPGQYTPAGEGEAKREGRT